MKGVPIHTFRSILCVQNLNIDIFISYLTGHISYDRTPQDGEC